MSTKKNLNTQKNNLCTKIKLRTQNLAHKFSLICGNNMDLWCYGKCSKCGTMYWTANRIKESECPKCNNRETMANEIMYKASKGLEF